MTSNNEALYKAKQDWLDRLFASELTPATKCFAWGVFKRMYGVKIVSNPGSNTIYDDTKVGKSKHSDHRKKLAGCGAMSMKLVKNDKGDWDSYEYTLNLHWDGNGALLIEGSNPQGTTPEIDSSTTSEGSYPEGTTLPPTGYEGTTQRVGGVLPTGSSNTTINTTKKTVTNTLKNTPPAAAESVISDSKEDVDDSPLLVVNEDSPLSVVTDSAFDVVKSDAPDDVESSAPAALEDEHDDDYWLNYDPFDETETKVQLNTKPSENGGVPEDIMNILEQSDNLEESLRLYLDPEFRSDRAETNETRAGWARDYAWQPKRANKTVDSSFGDEW